MEIGEEASKNGRNTRIWGDNQREVTRSHGSRDRAKERKSQWRGRMACAAARIGKRKRRSSMDDANAWRGKSASDASAWMTRSRDMCDLHNLQNSMGAILGLIPAQFSARNSRLESENMQKQQRHSFRDSFRSSFYFLRFFSLGFRILIFNWS